MTASSSMSNSVPAPKQRRLSIPTNQIQNRQFHRSESSPVPLGRAAREVPIATNTLKISTNTSRTLEEFEDTFGTRNISRIDTSSKLLELKFLVKKFINV